jgi:hypothetical protein
MLKSYYPLGGVRVDHAGDTKMGIQVYSSDGKEF